MTNDQWEFFEETLQAAPQLVQDMYRAKVTEIRQDEMAKLTTAVLYCVEALEAFAASPNGVSQSDFAYLASSVERLVSAMYGRMLGIARSLDEAVTKQVVLEAELAAAGK
jgi:hypothetical protein